jgi:hypothetical protein
MRGWRIYSGTSKEDTRIWFLINRIRDQWVREHIQMESEPD